MLAALSFLCGRIGHLCKTLRQLGCISFRRIGPLLRSESVLRHLGQFGARGRFRLGEGADLLEGCLKLLRDALQFVELCGSFVEPRRGCLALCR